MAKTSTRSAWLDSPPARGGTDHTEVDTNLTHRNSSDDEFRTWPKASSQAARGVLDRINAASAREVDQKKATLPKSVQLERAFRQREAKMRVEVSMQREEEFCQAFLQCCLESGLEGEDTAGFLTAWRNQIAITRRLEAALDATFAAPEEGS